MKNPILLFLLLISTLILSGQNSTSLFEPIEDLPFGSPNPDASVQISDWAEMIGESDCSSLSRNPDGSWGDTINMIWRFKYIMNGFAVQDETF